METTENFNAYQSKKSPKDYLLESLILLSKFYNKPSSPHALIAGLPLVNDHLTLETFIRAAIRVDLSAKVMHLPLRDITPTPLPAVLLLTNDRTAIVFSIDSDGKAKVAFPGMGDNQQEINILDLSKDYTGTAILVAPIHRMDSRIEEVGETKRLEWFWLVMKRAWAVYGEIIIASFLVNMFALATPLFIMNVYDRVIPNQATHTLWVLTSGIIVIFVFDFIMRNLRSYFIDAAGRNIDVELSKNIFRHLLDIKMAERPHSVGTLANTVQTFESFREFITSATVSVLVDIPFVFLFLIIIALIGGWIVLIPFFAIPIVFLFGFLVQRPLDQLIRKSYQYSAEKHAVLVETLSSMETIKGMHVEGYLQGKWESVVEAATLLSIKLRILANMGINFSMLAQQLAVIALVIAGVYSIQTGSLTVGGLVACTILTSRALVPIGQIAGLLARYEQCRTAVYALDKVMQLPTERPEASKFLYLSQFTGDFEFRNVTFYYPSQAIPALNNVSFKIRAKEKVGIIGATGSGKSTIIKLMMKFYEPMSGNILLDGYEGHQLDPAEIRSFIGYVPQDVTLFHGTIRENIIFGAPYVDDNAVIRAAKLSTVDRFVADHPEGFNRSVGERGQFLSGGQRQSVVISRALVLDPPVLLFDELSDSMDDHSTTLLIQQLKTIIPDKTLVLVTHKALMLNLVDRLIVLDRGRIAFDGPRDAVLKQLSERKAESYGK